MEIRLPIFTHNYVLLCVSAVFVYAGVSGVSAIDVYTPAELFAENGTTATLSCSFKSREIFYYSGGKQFPGSVPQFKSRVEWAGDMNKKDVSIRVLQMQFKDNGTFSCDVKNPPDISRQMSFTKVRVVMKEALPQTSAAVIVCGVIGAVIGIIIIAVVTYLIIRRQEPSHDYRGGR
ncbi:myelin protein zero-like protein 1 isoform X3 [Sinocyclocheilus rhinocerous]|uniref:myelin protein zero-like protein 1 isoform X3 n=1 Tax=Sinocyclocheilus rhinocerous TaxID=307959 RepID=UPI0007B86B80|nr:PREDICTED: myelin protein zero-like protein 1 isoform X3 [Sinocyclocheilus rhinocerous]